MNAASQVVEWALGGAFALLGVLVATDWLRHRDRGRRYLALSAVLLCGVAVINSLASVTGTQNAVVTPVLLVMFVASGWALFRFRDDLIPLRRVTRWAVGTVVLVTIAALLVAYTPGQSGNQLSLLQSSAALLLVVVWAGCVLEPLLRFLLRARGLPGVQRSRLRALTLAYVGIILVLALSVASALSGQGSGRLDIVVTSLSLLIAPLFYVAFAPPVWLRRLWREQEEEAFRGALNELLLYSPDRETLAQRAAEWAARLVGADGSVIATEDGEVMVTHGLDGDTAQRIVRAVAWAPDGDGSERASLPPNVIEVPLRSELGRGTLAVQAGPLTPLFGDEEVARLREYASALTSALDRVQLVESLRRSAQLLDLAYDAILTWGVEGQVIRYWNRGAEEVYGWSAEEAVGKDPGDLLKSELPETRDAIVDQLRRLGHWEGEVRHTTKDGRRIDVSARWALQKDHRGHPDSVLEINRDVTGDKQAAGDLRRARDDAERASLAKSEYLSRMSHELRTPLTAMLGYSDLLELRKPRDDQLEAIAAIQQASGHLLSLVNDVLDIARIESGRETLAPESVSVAATIDSGLRLVAPAAMERNIALSTDLGELGYAYVQADHQRLNQAVLNLLSNAVKYSGEGARIAVRAERAADERVRIAVSDTGPGLTAEQQSRLFQPFDRLGAERTTTQGTGLGLALTKKLIEAMNGEIGVESTPGKGSTFSITLDRAHAAPQADGRRDEALPSGSDGTERTVLYVEDNLATVALMEEIFAMRPQIRLITAMQGGLTLDLAREHHPDLVVLDLQLPDISGDEVLRRLRADVRTAHIPIVMFSADATERQVKRLLGMGARSYLTKPVKVKEFLRTLDEVLNTPAATRH